MFADNSLCSMGPVFPISLGLKEYSLKVYIILDASGSMSVRWDEVLGSINEYVSGLSKDTIVYLSRFAPFSVIYNDTARNWKNIDKHNMREPNSMTPLYDSVGRVIELMEMENPDRAVLVVVTDGFDNTSMEFTKQSIKAKIERVIKSKDWPIVFLGSDFDAVSDYGESLGTLRDRTIDMGVGGHRATMSKMSANTMAYAASGMPTSMDFTEDDRKAARPN